MIATTLPWYQALLMGVLQGVTELFPVSSLGHAVLFPDIFGWTELAAAQSEPESYFLAFLVALHVGTAIGLIAYYFSTWRDLIQGLFQQLTRSDLTPRQRLNPSAPGTSSSYRLLFLLVAGTIPVGVVGLIFEHRLRTVFAVPRYSAMFLFLNGIVMLTGEVLRRRANRSEEHHELSTMTFSSATVVGSSQIAALFAGISRSGISMVAGLLRGMSHRDAANFSFLLATPIILAAGLYKLPDFFGPLGDGIRTQAIVASVVSGVASYLSVRFLSRWFTTHTLWPFGIYCLIVGSYCFVRFG
jgi:undecaprenyl-diphosphatase